MKNFIRTSTITLFSLLLAACGFHFQPNLTLTPKQNHFSYQSNSPYSYVSQHLRQDLAEAGLNFGKKGKQITVSNINMTQQVYGSSTAITQVDQYSIFLSMDIAVSSPKGKTIIPKRRLSSSRIITVNANQMLGTDNATRVVRDEMIQDISQQILAQLASRSARMAF